MAASMCSKIVARLVIRGGRSEFEFTIKTNMLSLHILSTMQIPLIMSKDQKFHLVRIEKHGKTTVFVFPTALIHYQDIINQPSEVRANLKQPIIEVIHALWHPRNGFIISNSPAHPRTLVVLLDAEGVDTQTSTLLTLYNLLDLNSDQIVYYMVPSFMLLLSGIHG